MARAGRVMVIVAVGAAVTAILVVLAFLGALLVLVALGRMSIDDPLPEWVNAVGDQVMSWSFLTWLAAGLLAAAGGGLQVLARYRARRRPRRGTFTTRDGQVQTYELGTIRPGEAKEIEVRW